MATITVENLDEAMLDADLTCNTSHLYEYNCTCGSVPICTHPAVARVVFHCQHDESHRSAEFVCEYCLSLMNQGQICCAWCLSGDGRITVVENWIMV